jgi:hypothetical protein
MVKMSELFERRIVACPYHRAQGYLAQIVETKADSGAAGTLTLSLAVPGGELAKDVVVRFGRAVDPMHFDQPWQIRWAPTSGPYPDFEGELTVRADETYATSQLELRGGYRPPGGALGEVFDWAVGTRIARATAQALLERIGGGMEIRYSEDEAAKTAGAAE